MISLNCEHFFTHKYHVDFISPMQTNMQVTSEAIITIWLHSPIMYTCLLLILIMDSCVIPLLDVSLLCQPNCKYALNQYLTMGTWDIQ